MKDCVPTISIIEEFTSSCVFGTSANIMPSFIDYSPKSIESLLHKLFFYEQMHIIEDATVYYIDAVDIAAQKRENLAEILFETYSCQRLILGYRPLLAGLYHTSAFTKNDVVTGIVIDLGKSIKITPIYKNVPLIGYVETVDTKGNIEDFIMSHLGEVLSSVVEKCPIDTKTDIKKNIIVTGELCHDGAIKQLDEVLGTNFGGISGDLKDVPKFWAWKGARMLCNTVDLRDVSISAEEYAERGAVSCHKIIKTVY